MGGPAMDQLRELLMKWLQSGQIRNEEATRILILNGSHGTPGGFSVLSDPDLADFNFYVRDC